MADALVLGTSLARGAGSSPVTGTMGNDWGSNVANHGAIVGIIRVPLKGWPVKCPSCGNIGWRLYMKDAKELASTHRRANAG